MSGGSFKDCNDVLTSFYAKRKTHSVLFVPSVMLHYKPKIKDLWYLMNMQKHKFMFIQTPKNWKSDSYYWMQVIKLTCMY